MLASSKTNLLPEHITTLKPSKAEQRIPFLVKNRRSGDMEVALIVSPKGVFNGYWDEAVVLFIEIHDSSPRWCGTGYLDMDYDFVRYLTEHESITITGAGKDG